MRSFVICLGCWLAIGSIDHSRAEERQPDESARRSNLQQVILSDGTVLVLYAEMRSAKATERLEISAFLYPKGSAGYFKQETLWNTDRIASLDDPHKDALYYALVKATADQVLIFCTWNGDYCKLDRHTGRILEQARGDNVLFDCEWLTPLKLTFIDLSRKSTGRSYTQDELNELEKQDEELKKEAEEFDKKEELDTKEAVEE